ncbi:MAG: hypothetical protein A3G60_03785 [Candidatus Ryanbacteria bacterium RIFCSPLOWO2_12_FULL_47_9c]|uniref:MobA-like NTP transferase domain-containing protein n=2 Tax=Candidatus Ryaniibacteriota TaxID=1817914 RepID=A0A1G2H448_9BACT|nr:MAG: hypothetical protein UX74_C0020G0006 [Parcubacteria group bacterium GW2011_GWA2_47_10b]KKU85558.1 MAG: hypothetical protein UY14_C0020G0003 [Parcubacteria group bacterium GW2011_GWA1_47_9]OGZ56223.1 MAG: hypothetical protein A3J04_01890 [Candidatus Ryanbacteria bacterium RIFCSPLOWO2_02_FULL_47_14]OGZ57252.1 MAG: hypothetical protein A3G60_03785 [Candidatus Ryanbacteria bacterium RIFCSPLOWO2_12_FULL_47_9c]
MNTKAIILAAGTGSRLGSLTKDTPKGLLDIEGTRPLVRLVDMLETHGVNDIVIAVGHQKEKIKEALGSRVRYHEFSDFNTKNNLHTLWSMRDELSGNTLVLYADMIFESDVLKRALNHTGDICLTVDTGELRSGSPQVKMENGKVTKIDKSDSTCNFLGITKLSRAGTQKLVAEMALMQEHEPNAYYSDAINSLIQKGHTVSHVDVAGTKWVEIDDPEDIEPARALTREIS